MIRAKRIQAIYNVIIAISAIVFIAALSTWKNKVEEMILDGMNTLMPVIVCGGLMILFSWILCRVIRISEKEREAAEKKAMKAKEVTTEDFEFTKAEEADTEVVEELLKPIVIEEAIQRLKKRERKVPLTEEQLNEIRNLLEDYTVEEIETL